MICRRVPQGILDLDVLLVERRYRRRRQVQTKDVKCFPLQQLHRGRTEEADLKLADALVFFRELNRLLDGLFNRLAQRTGSLQERPLPPFRLRAVSLAMRGNSRLHLVLNDVQKRCSARSQLSRYDEGKVMWNIVCVVIFPD